MEDLESFKELRDVFITNKLVDDTVILLNKQIKNKKRILVEDSSSVSMDIDTGLYPYTDSFHTTTGAVCTGLGVPEEAIETTIGVFSAVSIISRDFMRRIEDFPTHISSKDDAYESIQRRLETQYKISAGEYAFGWTDLNMIRHAELINKLSSLMLTHLDVLSDLDSIKVATKYTLDEPNEETQIFDKSLPALIDDWEKMVPQFTEMPGWKSEIKDIQSFEDMPSQAKTFVRYLEQMSKKEV
jgi:adenylosuccinate synthase